LSNKLHKCVHNTTSQVMPDHRKRENSIDANLELSFKRGQTISMRKLYLCGRQTHMHSLNGYVLRMDYIENLLLFMQSCKAKHVKKVSPFYCIAHYSFVRQENSAQFLPFKPFCPIHKYCICLIASFNLIIYGLTVNESSFAYLHPCLQMFGLSVFCEE
jgi:hypothetical protein